MYQAQNNMNEKRDQKFTKIPAHPSKGLAKRKALQQILKKTKGYSEK